jgi:hypothetical protein
MLQGQTNVGIVTIINRRHVPVAIKLVIDIATDIYKPGHAGQILTLSSAKKTSQHRNINSRLWHDNEVKLANK